MAETYEDEYPNVKFATWAYTWSAKPPESDTKLHDNIILYYNTLVLCPSHEYSDTTCKFNKTSAEYIRRWGEVANELYLWEHTGCFTNAMTPFPDFDTILANAKYFDDNGVEGAFLNSMSGNLCDFSELRAFLFSRVYHDPQMSREEYSYLMNGFLKTYYGDGWKAMRSYIDTVTELGNEKCHSFHSSTSGYYDYDDILAVIDEFDAYWDEAEAKANTAEQLDRIQYTRLSWTYLKQCALYDSQFKNGTEAQKKAYEAANQALLDGIVKYDVHITENYKGDYDFNISISPENWV